jgi:hypothetical protein
MCIWTDKEQVLFILNLPQVPSSTFYLFGQTRSKCSLSSTFPKSQPQLSVYLDRQGANALHPQSSSSPNLNKISLHMARHSTHLALSFETLLDCNNLGENSFLLRKAALLKDGLFFVISLQNVP